MKRILITGANSFVGTNIVKWLIREPDQFQVDTVDTMNEAWKKADFTKYDVVFHVAGIAHVNPKLEMAPLYYKVNRDLTIEIANWAKEHGVKQFIYMSSKIVYHASKSLKGDWVRKDTKPDPNDFYGDSKLQAEKGLKGLQCNTFKVAIIRPPMIYGKNSKGNFKMLVKLADKVPVFPNVKNERSMIYVENLAEFLCLLVESQKSGVFLPQNASCVTTAQMVAAIATAKGKNVHLCNWMNPFVALAKKMPGKIGGMAGKAFGSMVIDQELSREKIDGYQRFGLKESVERCV